jgi:hypothetical protein
VSGINDVPILIESSSQGEVHSWITSVFRYWKSRPPALIYALVLAGIICGCGGYWLMCHGTPEKKLTQKTLEKFIPELRSNTDIILPPEMGGHSYSRAEEAKQMAASVQASRSQKSTAIHYEGPALIVRPRDIQIPPGTMVKAKLTSGGGNSRVKAVLLESVVAQGETLIEQGSTFLGQGSST